MIYTIAVLAHAVALTAEPPDVVGEVIFPPADLQIDGNLDPTDPDNLANAVDTVVPSLPSENLGDPTVEPPALTVSVGSDGGWLDEGRSNLAYAVTNTISVGVAYELEEIEDLTANFIEVGTASVDYTSHNVVIRAHWSFDLSQVEGSVIQMILSGAAVLKAPTED